MWNEIKKTIWDNKESIIAYIKGYFERKNVGTNRKSEVNHNLKETGNKWGKTSLANIKKLSEGNQLRRFLEFAEKYLHICTVTDTKRTTEEQAVKFKQKKSKLDGVNKLSKHQLDKAFDIVPYPLAWESSANDWIKLHVSIAVALHEFNKTEKEPLVLDWGGYWNTSKTSIGWDNAHYER